MKFVVIFITASNEKEAKNISDTLVQERLAACTNLTPVRSTFFWSGKIEHENEFLLIVKTRKERVDDIITRVKELHSYSVPEIIALPIDGGNQDYLRWIEETVL
jgi:periplasmic divalent cation tolerance protein